MSLEASVEDLDVTGGVALITDGSCWTGDATGGWAFILLDSLDGEVWEYGYDYDTTVNRMEMTAVLKGLESLYETFGPIDVVIYSDSKYVILGSEDRTRARKVNKGLWRLLDKAVDSHNYVEWHHVKGHSDWYYNNLADKLAGEARQEAHILGDVI